MKVSVLNKLIQVIDHLIQVNDYLRAVILVNSVVLRMSLLFWIDGSHP